MKLSVIPAAFNALRRGEVLLNADTWRTRGAIAAGVAAFMGAVAAVGKALGHDWSFLLDPETQAATGFIAALVVGLLTHAATKPEFGLLPRKAGGPPESGAAEPAPQMGGIDADTVAKAKVWARSEADREAP